MCVARLGLQHVAQHGGGVVIATLVEQMLAQGDAEFVVVGSVAQGVQVQTLVVRHFFAQQLGLACAVLEEVGEVVVHIAATAVIINHLLLRQQSGVDVGVNVFGILEEASQWQDGGKAHTAEVELEAVRADVHRALQVYY